MPFGLATAFSTFMQHYDINFLMLYTTCLVYIDDIFVLGQNYIEMLSHLDTALKRLVQANLKLKPCKYAYKNTSVNILGHAINVQGISTDPEKYRRIKEWPRLNNLVESCSFLGYETYFQFIKIFAHIV